MSANPKRDKLIDAAAELFHKRGLGATSLADIAAKADIAIGNVYYYFKTKEELALCTLEKRKDLMQRTYAAITDAIDSPRERLQSAVRLFEKVSDDYTLYGCPIGRVIAESQGISDGITRAAISVLDDFVMWAATQFEALGHGEDALRYATQLMSSIQGATIMAKASGSPTPLLEEIEHLCAWLEELPNRKIHLGKIRAA